MSAVVTDKPSKLHVPLTAECRRRLEVEAIEDGVSVTEHASRLLAEHANLSGAWPYRYRGRQHRSRLATLIDSGGEFSRRDVQRLLGIGYHLAGYHLREAVEAGLLEERIVDGATGGLKLYRGATT